LAAARASFGDHFHPVGRLAEFPDGHFDFIYHVGTVGCVDDPIGFIRDQLRLLRRGGVLLFNAPNLDACHALDLPWLSGAAPPDLVTVFPPDFWQRHFSALANISVRVAMDLPLTSFRRRREARSRPVAPMFSLFGASAAAVPTREGLAKRGMRSVIRVAGRLLPPVGPFVPLPQEFGVYVRMEKTR
jgi:SAM-dependent methyltransferase